MRLVWKSAEYSNENSVIKQLCETLKHCLKNERSFVIFLSLTIYLVAWLRLDILAY